MWHGGSEGSGDGVSPPCPQADHLPGQRVQLLVRKSPLLTWNERGTKVELRLDGTGEPGGVGARATLQLKSESEFQTVGGLTKCEQSLDSNVTQLLIR